MSAIAVGGTSYAAGLYWLGRGGQGATSRAARRLGRPWCVHRGGRTGYAAGDTGGIGHDGIGTGIGAGPEGLPSLALALLDRIDGDFWMALVEGDSPEGDTGTGDHAAATAPHYALVKARSGAILTDGDEIFDTRAAALDAFARARPLGWTLHATPGLITGGAFSELDTGAADIAELDIAALAAAASKAGDAIGLRRVPPPRRAGARVALAMLGLTVLAGASATWFQWDAVWAWFAGPAPMATVAPVAEPRVSAAIDSAALIAACRQAMIEHPPWLPAWRIERLVCVARFADPELTVLRPELAGRAVLLARWRLAPGHAEPVQRQLAESHLSRWYAASVMDGSAWAAVTLEPVLRAADTEPPPFLALRRAVDRSLGAGGARIGYVRTPQSGWTVRIDDPGPLSRLGPLIAGIPGLEITALSRGADGGWRLDGRPMVPERLTRTRFLELTRSPSGTRDIDDGINGGGLPLTPGSQEMNDE